MSKNNTVDRFSKPVAVTLRFEKPGYKNTELFLDKFYAPRVSLPNEMSRCAMKRLIETCCCVFVFALLLTHPRSAFAQTESDGKGDWGSKGSLGSDARRAAVAPGGLIPKLPETSGSVMIDVQEWPQKPGPRQVQVWVHYPERSRLSSVNAQTGIMLSLHNWGGSYNVGTADPNKLAERYNVIGVCVDYLQSGAQASIRDPEPYDYGYLQALDVLRALHFVTSELKAKNIAFDSGRIFSTGGSGGGNVSLMANKLAPRTFAGIIDLCGMPKLTDIVAYNLPGSGGLDARYSKDSSSPNYLSADAQEIRFAGHPEHLRLMKSWGTSSKVIVVHGVDDKLFLNEVKELVENMKSAGLDVQPHFITADQVDGKVFTTTGHALGNRTLIVQQVADKYLLPTSKDALHRATPTDFERRDQIIRYPTANGVWVISYATGYPVGRFEPS